MRTMFSWQVGLVTNSKSPDTAQENRLSGTRLGLNIRQMEHMECGGPVGGTIAIDGVDLEKVAKFKYKVYTCRLNVSWA